MVKLLVGLVDMKRTKMTLGKDAWDFVVVTIFVGMKRDAKHFD